MGTYKELSVYRKAYGLVLEVYTLTKGMPKRSSTDCKAKSGARRQAFR